MSVTAQFRVETDNELQSALEQPVIDAERIIRDVVERHRRPPSLRDSVHAIFRADASGEPAVYLIFNLNEDDHEPGRIDELSKLSSAIVRELLDNQLAYWPYIRFDAGKN